MSSSYLNDDKEWGHAFWSLASFWAHAKGGKPAHEAALKLELFVNAALSAAYADGRKDEAEGRGVSDAYMRGEE